MTAEPLSQKCPFAVPEGVRGMKSLDRTAFDLEVTVTGLKVPLSAVGSVSKRYKNLLLKIPKLKPIADLSDNDPDRTTHKLFLFNPDHIRSSEAFSKDDREYFYHNDINIETCQQYAVKLTYENWTYDEVLDAILPEGMEGVGGFSIVGHIAHLNLRDHLLEYKHIIGQVILDKLPPVKTVVHKTHTIDNTFRNFQMEVLAGETNFVTIAREHGFAYKLDFSKVYWNPRLATEHQRIVALLNKDDIIYDVFAGVGPFAIPAAKKGCIVFANDLNPESYNWLLQNVVINKVQGKVQAFNLDGRDFISTIVKSDILSRWKNSAGNGSMHIVMNLPALAIEFLDAFIGLASPADVMCPPACLPMVHCYCFSRSEDPELDAAQRTAAALGLGSFEQLSDQAVRTVRNVAPGKEMLCVSFRLCWSVLTADRSDDKDEPVTKKIKSDENEIS